MSLVLNINNINIKVENREEWKQLKKFLGKAGVYFADGDSVKKFKLDKSVEFPLHMSFSDQTLDIVWFNFYVRATDPTISVDSFMAMFTILEKGV